jgi:hypothetical protein
MVAANKARRVQRIMFVGMFIAASFQIFLFEYTHHGLQSYRINQTQVMNLVGGEGIAIPALGGSLGLLDRDAAGPEDEGKALGDAAVGPDKGKALGETLGDVDGEAVEPDDGESHGFPSLDHIPSKLLPAGSNDKAYHVNPWYGWQPKIAPTMECSWRQCLKTVHKCKTCRDSQEDIEPAPPPPSEDWVPDVTMLRRMLLEGHDSNGNPWPPPLDEELCEHMGTFGGTIDENIKMFEASQVTALPLVVGEVIDGPKILCLVYTMAENHATNIRAIRETWGGGCDGFLAFSTESDPRIPAISIPHDGPESYENMWQKVRPAYCRIVSFESNRHRS